jgi:hypothetical protein
MILKARSWSCMSCWSYKSDHWSFRPPWAFALWVSFLWKENSGGYDITDKKLRIFPRGHFKSIHWNRGI